MISNEPPPDLPPAEATQRFQFHLKHLLAFMLASAMLAAVARVVLDWLNKLPEGYLSGWLAVLLGGLAAGFLAYFCLRGPFLVLGMLRASRRMDSVAAHRRDLAQWADARRGERGRIMDAEGEREA